LKIFIILIIKKSTNSCKKEIEKFILFNIISKNFLYYNINEKRGKKKFMNNSKKLVKTTFVVLFFISMFIFSTSAFRVEEIFTLNTKGNIIYVGGSGEGNYSRIQDAINNANNGDTVFVFNGTYHENHILVDKTLNLIGEDKFTTIIDGGEGGDILYIIADNVCLNGFTFQRSGGNNTEAIHQSRCDNSIITDNIIQSIGEDGIWLFRAHNNIIKNNTIQFVKGTGLMLSLSSYNVVAGNTFVNNGAGIGLDLTTNTTITENIIQNNQGGIYLSNIDEISNDHYGYNTISMNSIENNSYCGIYLYLSYSNSISLNSIVNNKLGVWVEWSILNKIEKNNIIGNKRQAKFETALKISWNENYWGKTLLFPKPLFGIIYRFTISFPIPIPVDLPINGLPIPGFQFDWHPAIEPYKI